MQDEGGLGDGWGASTAGEGSALEQADELWLAGDWIGAEAGFERAFREGSAAAAWRLGALLYLQGDRARSEQVLRAPDLSGPPSADGALVTAWLSAAVWRSGRTDEAEDLAAAACHQAAVVQDARAIAAAEVARALVCASRGDRLGNLRAYRAAQRAAADAKDVIQTGRILSNLSSKFLEEGDYEAAVRNADSAIQVAEKHRPIVALALENKAEALIRLGSLDLARAAASEAIEAYLAEGSRDVAGPELLLGEVYRLRGDRVQARLAFERALLSAERVEDSHRLASACAGLTWVCATDASAAEAFAKRAIDESSALEHAQALNACAWAALVGGAPARAADLAVEAELDAQRTGDRSALATALELRAVSTVPADVALMRTAADIWTQLGDPIAAARTELSIATLVVDPAAASSARQVLAQFGASGDVGVTGSVLAAQAPDTVSIATLGRFAVNVAGQRVPAAAWQSRKVRELLKLLAARNGRTITREAAAEALWPGDPYHLSGARLSVLLTRLRGVLDPYKLHPQDHYLDADKASLGLRADNVHLDVLEFLTAAELGSRLASQGRLEEAEAPLQDAELLYVGDFLEDDSDADWAVDCRERARSAAIACARLLARISARRGDDEQTARWLLRLIERDPYDEDAWSAIIAAHVRMRRHGEARHHHATYARRMRELDLPVEPFEGMPDRLP
ncbi:MAG: BTAD domain-containing putative transcriptional regulator [Marmoricola sp.]